MANDDDKRKPGKLNEGYVPTAIKGYTPKAPGGRNVTGGYQPTKSQGPVGQPPNKGTSGKPSTKPK